MFFQFTLKEAERLGPAGLHLRKRNIHSCHIPGCGEYLFLPFISNGQGCTNGITPLLEPAYEKRPITILILNELD